MKSYFLSKNHIRPAMFNAVIALLVVSLILNQLDLIAPANALTRYFNCITRTANNNGNLTLENVEGCYYKVFQGARDNDADGNKLK